MVGCSADTLQVRSGMSSLLALQCLQQMIHINFEESQHTIILNHYASIHLRSLWPRLWLHCLDSAFKRVLYSSWFTGWLSSGRGKRVSKKWVPDRVFSVPVPTTSMFWCSLSVPQRRGRPGAVYLGEIVIVSNHRLSLTAAGRER